MKIINDKEIWNKFQVTILKIEFLIIDSGVRKLYSVYCKFV